MIAPGEVIAGRPALEVRDIMRRMRERGYTCLGLARELRMDEMTARRLLADLFDAGLVERYDAVGGTIVVGEAEQGAPVHELELFASAIAGNALAKARTGRKMPRTEAYELLQGVIDRAEGVNHDDTWLTGSSRSSSMGAWRATAMTQWAMSTWVSDLSHVSPPLSIRLGRTR